MFVNLETRSPGSIKTWSKLKAVYTVLLQVILKIIDKKIVTGRVNNC